MKNILAVLLTFLTLNCFSQTILSQEEEFPRYYIVNNDTVGVILSINQARSVDNDLDLLLLLEKMRVSCDSTIKSYVIVVNESQRVIASLEAKNEVLRNINSTQREMISNLNSQIDNYKMDIASANTQLDLKDQIIKNQNKRISNLKIQRNLTIGGGVLTTALGIIVTFLILK